MVAPPRKSHHDFDAFKQACSVPGTVNVRKQARADAKQYFNFATGSEIVDFIYHDTLPDLKYDNTAPLDKGPQQDIGKLVDGYTLKIGPKPCYLAFYKNFKDIWIVKSFHPPDFGEEAEAMTHSPFLALKELKK